MIVEHSRTGLFILLAFGILIVGTVGNLELRFATDSSSEFRVELDSKPWLSGGKFVKVGRYDTRDGSLVKVGNNSHVTGTDKLGSYSAVVARYAKKSDTATVIFQASFRTYPENPSFITFEQFFPETLNREDLATSNESQMLASTIFPSFDRKMSIEAKNGKDLDCFSYHGVFPAVQSCSVSTYKESHQGGAPLIIYDSSNKTLPMTVFSPLNFPKAFHMASDDSFIGAGIKKTVTEIPKGYKQLFLLSSSSGINAGMMDWGNKMLKFTGKPRANMYHDKTHSTIGFWTDNGGYYHYDTGVDKSKSYMDVLPQVKKYHDRLNVPFGHWQFDSWFYPKDGGVAPGGGGGAVTNWTNLETVFPDNNDTGVNGMVEIQNKLQLPIVMHNRQWSTKSDYIKHLQFEWYISEKAAVPKDPKAFFAWFFKQQKGWGLSMYEQDWMCTEYDLVEALQTNISMGDLWLEGMAYGVDSANITQQYCMPYAHDILSASAHKAVTNARATFDYFHTGLKHDNWAIGATSLFYWAVGILPFKDGFYSSTYKQVGGQTVGPELNPDRECLMATLSCAMVGPMDGINLLNKYRVMTSCRSDGTLLKPDKPVSTSDSCFRNADPSCLVYNTFSDVHEYGRVYYYYNDAKDSQMLPEMIFNEGDDNGGKFDYVVYNWYTGEITAMNPDGNHLSAGYEEHVFAIVSPMIGGFAFVGERSKYVTAAKVRFESVIPKMQSGVNTLSVSVIGMKDENVEVCVVSTDERTTKLNLQCKVAKFEENGTVELTFK